MIVRCPWGAHGPKRDRCDTVKMVAENDGEHYLQHYSGVRRRQGLVKAALREYAHDLCADGRLNSDVQISGIRMDLL
jgi:hypothetical protein